MLFDPKKLLIIAGPCSLENERTCRAVAEVLVKIARQHPELTLIFKGSFDKANRTSAGGARGTGLEEGLALLAMVKRDYGFPVLTDVHEREQMKPVAKVCDVIQIPAFLCRQTDLLLAAAATGRVVNVKKGQFLSPQEMAYVTGKLREGKAKEIWQTERGTTFGYNNLVVDMRSFPIMARNGYPTILDATHSVQLPGRGRGQERRAARVRAAARQGRARRGGGRTVPRDASRSRQGDFRRAEHDSAGRAAGAPRGLPGGVASGPQLGRVFDPSLGVGRELARASESACKQAAYIRAIRALP